jgi:hypothetical protein
MARFHRQDVHRYGVISAWYQAMCKNGKSPGLQFIICLIVTASEGSDDLEERIIPRKTINRHKSRHSSGLFAFHLFSFYSIYKKT